MSGCASGTCTVTVDAIETFKSDVPGVFTDAAGAQTSFVLENLDLHLVQEVHGTLYQSRGTIVFPTESFVGSVIVGDAVIDGVSLGPWEMTQVVTTMVDLDAGPHYVRMIGQSDASPTLTLSVQPNPLGDL